MANTPITVTALWCQEEKQLRSPEYLLLLPLSDGAELRGAETAPLEPGTLLFLSPFSESTMILHPGSRAIYGVIDPAFLEEYVGLPKRASLVLAAEDGTDARERLIELFDLQYNEETSDSLELMRLTFELLAALKPMISSLPPADSEKASAENRTGRIVAYMEAHFREPIQLGDVAEAVSLSRQHLSEVFHQALGVTFFEYLKGLRLREAERLLLTSRDTITAIGENCGFPNLKSFNASFREKHGVSPKEFRKAHGSESLAGPEAPSSGTLANVNQLLSPFRVAYQRQEEPVRASDAVSLSGGTAFPPKWNDILNIDNAAECLQAGTQASLAAIQKDIGFRYARLHNFINQELTPYIAPLRQHRFIYLYRIIDFFRSIDLIPMLSFGSAYEVMMGDVMTTGSAYSVSQEDFLVLLEAMLRAFMERWGKEWVSRWRFEFHMPETLYGSADPEAFLDLFESSASLIHALLPEAEVGGPGLSMDGAHMPRWQAFMEGVQARKISVNFISAELWGDYTQKVSSFAGPFGDDREFRTIDHLADVDISGSVHKVRVLREQMRAQGLTDCKLYIAAMGVTKYQALPAQIAGHCAAHLTKLNMELAPLVDALGCWKALNQESEYHSEKAIMGTGCGLLSRFDLKNISYYAHHFMSRLLPIELFRGINCTVTTDGLGRFAILIYNCKTYSPYFCHHYLTPDAMQYWNSRLYVSASALRQKLSLTGTEPGDYLVQQYLIGDRYGCISAVIQELGEFQRNSEPEIRYIAGMSQPYQHNFMVTAAEALELSVTLQANEVMLLLAEPGK